MSVCVPGRANAVRHAAWPPVAADTATPEQPAIGAPPSVNVIVPPSGVGPTVAVSDTAPPTGAGFGDATSVVLVEVGAGAWAIVYAVTWSPLPTNKRPPPALGVAKWLTSEPPGVVFSGIEK